MSKGTALAATQRSAAQASLGLLKRKVAGKLEELKAEEQVLRGRITATRDEAEETKRQMTALLDPLDLGESGMFSDDSSEDAGGGGGGGGSGLGGSGGGGGGLFDDGDQDAGDFMS
jgi:hypothetical protein